MDPRDLRVLIFGASLRAGSFNARLAALAATAVERAGAEVDLRTMREFTPPAYDPDVERAKGLPGQAAALCERLEANDAFIIASPEYNASVPGILKNAIDWASRKRPQPFKDKHGLLLSASPSLVGGNRGLWAVRVPLEHLGAQIYPEMFSLARSPEAFTSDGLISDTALASRLDDTITGFLDLAEAAKHYPCAKARWYEFPGETSRQPEIQRAQT